MAHRFEIGTRYEVKTKARKDVFTVEDQMTVTNSKGEIVKEYYTCSHLFMDQKVMDHNVCDTTIARNLLRYGPPEPLIRQSHGIGRGKMTQLSGSIKTRFDKAYEQFSSLEAVDDDPARTNTVADLVFIAQFEVDLVEAGESDIDVRPHRKFIKKYS